MQTSTYDLLVLLNEEKVIQYNSPILDHTILGCRYEKFCLWLMLTDGECENNVR